MQLSKDHLTFEMYAYDASTLTPASDSVRISNPSTTPIPGFPNRVDVSYLVGMNWLTPQFVVDDPGYRIDVVPANVGTLDEGIYRANLAILWPGAANSPATVEVELIVHPSTEFWRQGEHQVVAYRFGHAAVALPGGGALLIGGQDVPPYTSPAASIERLDPYSGVWSAAGTLLRGRNSHTATLLADGKVLIAGGLAATTDPSPSATWELYDPDLGEVVDSGPLVQERYNHTAVRLLDGRVLLAGGAARVEIDGVVQGEPTRRCELFDPVTRRSTEVDPVNGASASEGTAVLLPDGRVLITDLTPAGSAVGTEIFDPRTGHWTAAASRRQLRAAHGLVGLPGGKVIVFGGLRGLDMTPLQTAEIYDPDTDSWSFTGSLNIPHVLVGQSAVALPSGRPLVAGGFLRAATDAGSLFPTAAVETFDLETLTWSISSALPAPLGLHTVTVLADGTIMAAGGYPNAENAAEFWREPD